MTQDGVWIFNALFRYRRPALPLSFPWIFFHKVSQLGMIESLLKVSGVNQEGFVKTMHVRVPNQSTKLHFPPNLPLTSRFIKGKGRQKFWFRIAKDQFLHLWVSTLYSIHSKEMQIVGSREAHFFSRWECLLTVIFIPSCFVIAEKLEFLIGDNLGIFPVKKNRLNWRPWFPLILLHD